MQTDARASAGRWLKQSLRPVRYPVLVPPSEPAPMKIRAFFLLSLAAAAAVGSFAAVVTLVSEWQHASAAAQAQQLAMAIRAGLNVSERLGLERGYYLQHILTEQALDAAEKAKIDKAKADTDAAFVEIIDRLSGSGIPDATPRVADLRQMASRLGALRT